MDLNMQIGAKTNNEKQMITHSIQYVEVKVAVWISVN